jgi:hypothetical protein
MVCGSWLADDAAQTVIVGLHTTSAPTDAEFDVYLAAIIAAGERFHRDPERIKALSITDGGALTATQRTRLNDAIGSKAYRVAIVTGQPVVRAIVTALHWFNPGIAAFAPTALAAAYAHLRIPPKDLVSLEAFVEEMLRQFPLASLPPPG